MPSTGRGWTSAVRAPTLSSYTSPTLKYGLGTHIDLEVNFAPDETVDTTTGQGTSKLGGVGDRAAHATQVYVGMATRV